MPRNFTINVATKDRYSKPINQAAASHRDFKGTIEATRAEIKKLNQTDRTIKAFGAAKRSFASTRKSLSELNRIIKETNLSKGKLVGENINIRESISGKTTLISSLEKEVDLLKIKSRKSENSSATTQKQISEEIALKQRSISQNRKEVAALTRKEKANKKNIELMNKEQATRKKNQKGMKTRYESEQKHLNALKTELTKTGVQTDRLASSQAKLKNKTGEATKKLEAQRTQLKRVAKMEEHLTSQQEKRMRMLGKAAPVGASVLAIKGTINSAANLQTEIVNVDKKAKFKNAAGGELSEAKQAIKLDQLGKQIIQNAPALGLKPTELANIIASGAGSNIARDAHEVGDLERFSVLAAKMANAFDEIEPDEAGKSVAAWKASMDLSMDELEETAGAINHFSDSTAANTTAMTRVMTDVGSVVKAAGLNHIQAAGLSAAILAANGNKAELGRTAAKNLAINMTLGDAASNLQKETFRSIGFSAVDVAKSVQQDSVGTMFKVFEAINKQEEYKQNAIIKTLFGRESIGSILPLIKNLKEMRRVMAATTETTKIRNSLDREFEKLTKTANFQEDRLESGFEAFTAVFGEQLLPMWTAGVEVLADLFAGTANWIQNNKELAGVLIKSAAVVAALKAAQFAYRLGAVSLDIAMSKRRISEAKLGSTATKTASAATLAARALDRLNLSLMSTGRGKASKSKAGQMAGAGVASGAVAGTATGGIKGAMNAAKSSKVPILGNVAAAGLLAYTMIDGESETIAQDIGSVGGSMAGAAAGAAIGSIVPFIGTLVGGIIGGIAGESMGAWLGEGVGDIFKDTSEIKPVTVDSIPTLKETQIPDVKPSPVSNKKEVKIEYKPQIVIQGEGNQAEVETALKAGETSLIQNLENKTNLFDDLETGLSDGIPTGYAY